MSTITVGRSIEPSRKGLHYSLWGAQWGLAILFAMVGVLKIVAPISSLESMAVMNWVNAVNPQTVRTIGWLELAAAFGMLLPSLLHLTTKWVSWAAGGLAALMGMAAIFHLGRAEYWPVVVNFALGAIAVFVAWGRYEDRTH